MANAGSTALMSAQAQLSQTASAGSGSYNQTYANKLLEQEKNYAIPSCLMPCVRALAPYMQSEEQLKGCEDARAAYKGSQPTSLAAAAQRAKLVGWEP
eukprot:COSAG03_NODE_3297_length_2096_cov_177.828242_2_plen_98_part_00